MIYPLTIIIFFVITCGLGSTILKNKSLCSKIAISLASIPILGIILNILHIPFDWQIFLRLALIAPCHQFLIWWRAGRTLPPIKLKRPSWQILLVLAIFIFTLAIYCWTMKFFNGLIICLGFLFFYMLITELSGNKSKGGGEDHILQTIKNMGHLPEEYYSGLETIFQKHKKNHIIINTTCGVWFSCFPIIIQRLFKLPLKIIKMIVRFNEIYV